MKRYQIEAAVNAQGTLAWKIVDYSDYRPVAVRKANAYRHGNLTLTRVIDLETGLTVWPRMDAEGVSRGGREGKG